VADDAARAAEEAAGRQPGNALAVVQAAQDGARQSLAHTPEQLAVLASAGVVDAGAQAYVLLLDALVEMLGGAPARPLTAATRSGPRTRLEAPRIAPEYVAPEYEVMYALRGAAPSDLDTLREDLSALGHSVVIVGDQAIAQVHVHLDEAGAAVVAALPLGELSQVRITAVHQVLRSCGEACWPSWQVQGWPRQWPRTTVCQWSWGGDVTVDQLRAAANQTCGDLVILPNGTTNLERASSLAAELLRAGRRVGVVSTLSQTQGLAAMAVHEPSADFESAVVAMNTAAGHTRDGAITVAESAVMTGAGPCRPGDVLGIVDGYVVVIGRMADVAWQVVERLLGAGGELLTLVRGSDADDDLLSHLTARVRVRFPAVDVDVVDGNQPRYPLLLGVE
jgi:dihydroxyacetone kinase-like predicted kinase